MSREVAALLRRARELQALHDEPDPLAALRVAAEERQASDELKIVALFALRGTRPYEIRSLSEWARKPGRTLAEALALLDKAIAAEEGNG